jgi:aryl-alcohol dehydrogenase-like predicted oxidoreductase
MDASLKRLGRDHVDLFQLHNEIGAAAAGATMSVEEALDAASAFETLRRQGKTRHIGFTAIGETAALHRLIDSRAYETAQVPYNALNPSAGAALPARYPAQDYGRMLDRMTAADMGSIGIRVLAAGALSGREERHPLGSQNVAPIGSGGSYKADVERARRLEPLVREGHAASLTEMAMRFAIANPALTTTEIGLANIEQLDAAIAAVEKGPLTHTALARLAELQAGFAGEPR